MNNLDELVELLTAPEYFEKLAEYADEHRQCCSSD